MVNLDAAPDFTAAAPVRLRRHRAVHRRVPDGADQHRRQQRRAAGRRRLAHQAGHDPARRLRPQLQRRLVLDDRAAAGRPAAVRRHQHRDRHRRATPLTIADPLATAPPGETTNNYGVRARLRARRGADVERRPVARPPAGVERRRRLHAHPRLEPRHRARARTAARTGCASTACSRSSGRRRKARRSLHAGDVPRCGGGR